MQGTQPDLQVTQAITCRLDDDLLFAILFDVPFPPVNRRHGWKDIDARRESLVDERAGEGGAIGVGCDSRQDEDDLWC